MSSQISASFSSRVRRDWFSVPVLKVLNITGKVSDTLAELKMEQYDEKLQEAFNKALYYKPLVAKDPKKCLKRSEYKNLNNLLKDERAKDSDLVKDYKYRGDFVRDHGIDEMLRGAMDLLNLPLVLTLLGAPLVVTDQIDPKYAPLVGKRVSFANSAFEEEMRWDSSLVSGGRPIWKCAFLPISNEVEEFFQDRAPREDEIADNQREIAEQKNADIDASVAERRRIALEKFERMYS